MPVTRLFKAAVLEEINKPLAIRTLEIPQSLSVGQVLIRIKYSGICGKQIAEQTGSHGPDRFVNPLLGLSHTLGHEAGGIVKACGPGVKHVRIGDHVVVHWRKGQGIDAEFPVYWCPELHRYIGGGANNTFQEYAVISENRLTKIPDDVLLDEAALLGCAVGTGIGAIVNDANVKPGQSVIVFGCGGVGLNVLQGCSLVCAYPVVGVDIADKKLQQAVAMGATEIINSITNPTLFTMATRGDLFDVAVDTTGVPAVIEQAWKIAKRVCLVAQVRHDKVISINTTAMQSGRTIFGTDGGMTNPTEDIPRYIKLLKAGRLNLRGLITHTCDLDGLNVQLDLTRAGEVGRGIIRL